jgi:tRNA threonylcarbamoyladenosine biosynthesis protein TsaE
VDPAAVASPTFVIAHEHVTRSGRRLFHVDCYRVETRGELEAAGFLDLLEPGAVLLVEWADRFPEALPADRLEVRLERPAGEAGRRLVEAVACGAAARELLARWRGRLEAAPLVADGWR